jgi:hypothetical protein
LYMLSTPMKTCFVAIDFETANNNRTSACSGTARGQALYFACHDIERIASRLSRALR